VAGVTWRHETLNWRGGVLVIGITELHFMLEKVEMNGRIFERTEEKSDTEQDFK
jgi:hypothetical protein